MSLFFSTLNFPRVGDKFPGAKIAFQIAFFLWQIALCVFPGVPGKIDLQIPCYPYVVATSVTVLHWNTPH